MDQALAFGRISRSRPQRLRWSISDTRFSFYQRTATEESPTSIIFLIFWNWLNFERGLSRVGKGGCPRHYCHFMLTNLTCTVKTIYFTTTFRVSITLTLQLFPPFLYRQGLVKTVSWDPSTVSRNHLTLQLEGRVSWGPWYNLENLFQGNRHEEPSFCEDCQAVPG
jgi:hypothetical protein